MAFVCWRGAECTKARVLLAHCSERLSTYSGLLIRSLLRFDLVIGPESAGEREMWMFETSGDPWRHTVNLLSSAVDDSSDAGCAYADLVTVEKRRLKAGSAGRCNPRDITIRLLERQGAVRATIAWHDPTRCSYGYQTWQAARARHSGICAVSGRPVCRGDEVYKPRLHKQRASNAGEMILASVLRTIEIDDVVKPLPPAPAHR